MEHNKMRMNEMEEDEPEITKLPDWVKPGVCFNLFYGKGNVNNQKYHIRAIVDEYHVVLRWFGTRRQWWHYKVEDIYFFEASEKHIKNIGKSKED